MMKSHTVVSGIIFLVILLSVSGVSAEAIPEFDGAYVKNTNGNYTEIKTTKAFWAATRNRKGLALKPTPCVFDKSSIPTFSASTFKGFFLKGNYNFQLFSLHLIKEYILEADEVLYDNPGPAVRGKPFYIPGDNIELRKKAVGTDAYYFEPREGLGKGEYVGWIHNDLWLFRLE